MKELTGDEIVCELLGLQNDVRIGALVASEADVCNTLATNWFVEDGRPEIFITLYPSTLTVAVRSRGPVRALDVASKYNGGGHVNAAGCSLPLEVFEKLFTEYHTYQQPRESKDSTEEKK